MDDRQQLSEDELDDLTPVQVIGPSPTVISNALQAGICLSDRAFDRFLPYHLRLVSAQFWTPIKVALRVAEWLNSAGVTKVVDIGSGAGKFCVAAALATRCSFIGVEQRSRCVDAARALAKTFAVDDRVDFLHGALDRDMLPPADAYYLFNPFEENLFESDDHLDEDVELSPERFARDIAVVEEVLTRAPAGTYVIKYNGFGGRMPRSYQRVSVALDMPNTLRMWRKGGATDRTDAA
jgi:SAM-dependent methyltransferase